jgi:hypothetical protein
MTSHDIYKCRVCGLDQYPDTPWGDNGRQPEYLICSCCGVESGLGDDGTPIDLAIYRKYWVEVKNCNWFLPEDKPLNWDMPAQIRGIAAEFAGPDDEKLIEYFLEHQKH